MQLKKGFSNIYIDDVYNDIEVVRISHVYNLSDKERLTLTNFFHQCYVDNHEFFYHCRVGEYKEVAKEIDKEFEIVSSHIATNYIPVKLKYLTDFIPDMMETMSDLLSSLFVQLTNKEVSFVVSLKSGIYTYLIPSYEEVDKITSFISSLSKDSDVIAYLNSHYTLIPNTIFSTIVL